MSAQRLPWLLLLMLAGCGGAQKQETVDLAALLSREDCAAVMANIGDEPRTPEQRGAAALCTLVAETIDSAQAPVSRAILLLQSGGTAEDAAISATRMMSLAPLLPDSSLPVATTRLHTALGAAGYGPFAVGTPGEGGSALELELAITSLEYLSAVLDETDGSFDQRALIDTWNGCWSLLAGTMAVDTDRRAWRLHTSIAAIALRLWDQNNLTDFNQILMESTIAAVEKNPGISVAARCDMAAPYDRLKKALSKKPELAGALERSVSAALGCTPGRYAPSDGE